MRENETPTKNENLAEKTEKFPPLRYPGETDEQYDARCTQEAERERIAEESRGEAKRMTGPELRADSLEDNGGQNKIDRERYHDWLEANAPAASEMSAEDLRAVNRVEEAIDFFNGLPAKEREAFLATGDAKVLAEGRADNIVQAVEEEIGFLQREGIFVKKGAGDELVVDPDFAAKNVRGEGKSFDLKDETTEWFNAKDAKEQADLLWAQSDTHEQFDSLSDEIKATLSDEQVELMKKEWAEKLSDDERKRLTEKSMAQYRQAIQDWNDIPAEKRANYMKSGNIAELTDNPADFDAGTAEGVALTGDLRALEELGVMSFGHEEVISENPERRDAFQEALESAEKAEAERNQAEQEKANREALEAFKDAHSDEIDPKTGEKYSDKQLEELFAREQLREERRKRLTELREKLDTKRREGSDALNEEADRLRAEDDSLSKEEALKLAGLTSEELAYQKRLLEMQKREARGETAETNFEGEEDREYLVVDDENERIIREFRSRKDADAFMKENADSGYRLVEHKFEDIDLENDSPEEVRRKLKWRYDRTAAQSQEEYDKYIDNVTEHMGGKTEAEVSDDESAGESTEPEEPEEPERPDEPDGGPAGESETPDEADEGEDEQVSPSERLQDLAENDAGFQAFLAEKHSSIAGERAGREVLSDEEAEKIIDEWEEAKNGDILAINTDYTENAQEAADNLAEWMFKQKHENGVRGLFRKYRTERIQKKYQQKAEELIATGDMSDRIWQKFDGVEEYLADYWSRIDSTKPFEEMYRNRDGAMLLEGESMASYGIKLNEAGEKVVVEYGTDGQIREIAEDTTDEHEQRMADVTLGLDAIIEDFLASEGTAKDFDEMKAQTRQLRERLTEDEQAGWSEDNFYDAVIAARDSVRYGRDIDTLTEGLRFINAEGGRSAERAELNRRLAERRAGLQREREAKLEYLPSANEFRLNYAENMSQLRSVIDDLRNNPEDESGRKSLIDGLGFLDMHQHRGLLFDVENAQTEAQEYGNLRREAIDVLASVAPAEAAETPVRAQVEQAVSNAERANLTEIEERYGQAKYDILGSAVPEKYGGENDWLFRKAIHEWNEQSGREQFKHMTGQGVNFKDMLLRDAGLLEITADRRNTSDNLGRFQDARFGVEAWYPDTSILASDASVKMIMREAEPINGAEAHDEATVKDALETWNNASALERRLYLIAQDKSYTSGREVAMPDDVREAGDVLRDMNVILPPAFYARTWVNPADIDEAVQRLGNNEGVDAGAVREVLDSGFVTWMLAKPEARREAIRTQGQSENLSEDMRQAYRDLSAANLVGDWMVNYS